MFLMGNKNDIGSLCQSVVFVRLWSGDDCGTFLNMGNCVSVEGVLYMFVRYLMANCPRCFRYQFAAIRSTKLAICAF